MSGLQKLQAGKETEELFLRLSADAHSDSQVYTCPLCRDTGWLIAEEGARPCACGEKARLQKRRRVAGLKPAMDEMRFAQFQLQYYSPQRQVEPGCTYRQAAERALRAARSFVAACLRGEAPRGLYFDGSLGSGKTFLAAAIANELAERGQEARFIVVPEFLEQLRLSYRERDDRGYDEAEMMREAMGAPVLILDDLGAHNSSPWTVGKIYTLLNHRLNERRPCVITTNLKPTALSEELGPRAASRIREMCDRYILLSDEDIRGKKRGGEGGWQG